MTNGVILVAAYFFANVGLIVLFLVFLTGTTGANTIMHLRAFREQTKLMTVTADSLPEEEASAVRIRIKSESHTVIAKLIISVVLSVGIVVWVAK